MKKISVMEVIFVTVLLLFLTSIFSVNAERKNSDSIIVWVRAFDDGIANPDSIVNQDIYSPLYNLSGEFSITYRYTVQGYDFPTIYSEADTTNINCYDVPTKLNSRPPGPDIAIIKNCQGTFTVDVNYLSTPARIEANIKERVRQEVKSYLNLAVSNRNINILT